MDNNLRKFKSWRFVFAYRWTAYHIMDFMDKKERQHTWKSRPQVCCFYYSKRSDLQIFRIPPLAALLYHSAGDFPSGIASWLRMEVIWITVNDHRPSYYLIHRKPICSKTQIRIPPAPNQRRQIACMFRVCLPHRVVMTFRARKSHTRTILALMDVEPKEPCLTFLG